VVCATRDMPSPWAIMLDRSLSLLVDISTTVWSSPLAQHRRNGYATPTSTAQAQRICWLIATWSKSTRFLILHYSDMIMLSIQTFPQQESTTAMQLASIHLFLAVIRRCILAPQEGTAPPCLRTASLQVGSTLQREADNKW